MFFILSKILAFLIMPMTWIMALLLYSWWTKDENRKRKTFKWAMILMLIFSNRFVFDEAMRAWEVEAIPHGSLHQYDAAIVLGGLSVWDPSLQRIQFTGGADRLFQALDLYKKGLVKRIVFTGGSGSILHQEYKESDRVKLYLQSIGIPDSVLVFESQSKNTYENAVMTKKILDSISPGGKYLLVSSGYHLRRAKGCFDKAGISTLSYSTDRKSGPRKFEFDHLLLPDADALSDWSMLLHEIVGYITYKISGYL
ncbi:MAG: hypothetical protein FD123_2946 [Bacteroidetes bacterium]|nr:MAG: hypothetical protein FD123_2946 [Bacteroidota bacterium]